jgi:ribosomal RNA-processing protein 17
LEQLREDRRVQFEEHVRAVKQLLKESETAGHEDDQVIEGDMEWDGIEDKPALGEFEDQEQEYIDDDRFTTVTIESVSVTRDGLEKPNLEDEDEDQRQGRANEDNRSAPASRPPQQQQAKKPPPPKHKKFRYESKHERKKTMQKQRGQKKSR